MKTALRLVLAVAWWSDCQAGDLANGVCGKPTDPCRTVQNVAACVALAAANCTTILVMESCPVQFACGDSTTPPPPSVCGSPTDPCMNQQSYMQCIALENGGCKDITARKSCPLQFACNDKPGISSVCGKPSDSCMNQKNWAKCKRLEKQCDVEMMETCPLQFACKQVPVPSVCGTPSDNCMTGALWRQCRKLEKAGCQRIVAGQSCPYSGFQCADPPDSCATFEVFESRRCQRGAAPPKTISIPVWSKPFDTCSSSNLIHGESANNRYCDAGGDFHEKTFRGSKDCRARSGNDLVQVRKTSYRPNKCQNRYILLNCSSVPCAA